MRSIKYIEKLKESKKWSNYRVAKTVGISQQAISQIMNSHNIMSDYVAVQVAELLDLNPMELIAICNMEREQQQKKKQFWEKMYKEITGIAAVIAIVLFASIGSNSVDLDDLNHGEIAQNWSKAVETAIFLALLIYAHNIYYVKQ